MTFTGRMVFTSNRSMEIEVVVDAEDVINGELYAIISNTLAYSPFSFSTEEPIHNTCSSLFPFYCFESPSTILIYFLLFLCLFLFLPFFLLLFCSSSLLFLMLLSYFHFFMMSHSSITIFSFFLDLFTNSFRISLLYIFIHCYTFDAYRKLL